MKLNIYAFNYDRETDWVIARSKVNAIKIHHSITDCDIDGYKGIVSLVTRDKWDKHTYFDHDPKKTITFREYMDKHAFEEDFFCSTAH